MTQNISHAVMAQRHEADDSLDDFPTQPWGSRALCKHVIDVGGKTVLEPAANRGYMARPLAEFAGAVFASDVHDYGAGYTVHDFLQPYLPREFDRPIDWVLTNPPFRLAQQFIERGLSIAGEGVAVLVRTSFIESVGRYQNLFSNRPPQVVAQFTERLPLVKGRVDRRASTATSYCWLVWHVGSKEGRTRLIWIPPCRAKLERDSDYPVAA